MEHEREEGRKKEGREEGRKKEGEGEGKRGGGRRTETKQVDKEERKQKGV